jgi:hypothetical protein
MQFGLDECLGVFSTPEKAQEALDKIKWCNGSNGLYDEPRYYVDKKELDKQYYG